jgi:hypothetical protein
MRKARFIAYLSFLLLLAACSTQHKYTSIDEAVKSQGIKITDTDSPEGTKLDGIKPNSYKFDNGDIIRIYNFETTTERELAYKHFKEKQLALSSYPPIIYELNNFLITYYSINSTNLPQKLTDTKYGKQLLKALNSLK